MVLSPVNLTEFIPEKIDLILHFPPYENIRKGREGQGGARGSDEVNML
jgi:hypothetical protein